MAVKKKRWRAQQPALGNVLKLRRSLERGVRAVVVHCARPGLNIDMDKGIDAGEVGCFQLFARLMVEREFESSLFVDVSALPQTNRFAYLERILKYREREWRLLNGSNYPYPAYLYSFPSIHCWKGIG